MKHVGSIIAQEITDKHIKRKDLCEYIGILPQSLANLLKKESFETSTLEKCCEYLHLDPAAFFDYRPYGSEATVTVGTIDQNVLFGDGEINISPTDAKILESLLKEKDARIRNLENTIKILERLIGNGNVRLCIPSESADE